MMTAVSSRVNALSPTALGGSFSFVTSMVTWTVSKASVGSVAVTTTLCESAVS